MSAILLLTGDATHAAATSTKTALESLGHVVTMTTTISTSADPYDLVVICRSLIGDFAAWGDRIKALYQAGTVPLLIGFMQGGSASIGDVVNSHLTRAQLIGAYEHVGTTASSFTTSGSDHPILDGISPYTTIQPYLSANYGSGLDETGASSYVGSLLGSNATSGRGSFFAISSGAVALDASPIGVKVVLADWVYGPTGYSVDGLDLMARTISWLLAPEAPSSGIRWPGYGASRGSDGKSAYAIAVMRGFLGTEEEWLASLVGPAGSDGVDGTDGIDGVAGPPGPPGAGLKILGTLASEDNLPAEGAAGDAYMIEGDLYIWSVLLEDWDNVGPLTGGGGGGGGGFPVNNYVVTSPSLLDGDWTTGIFTLSGAEVHHALAVTADRACRIRFYASAAQRSADLNRPLGMQPQGNHGVLLDVFLSSSLTQVLSPAALLFVLGTYGPVPYTLQNMSGVEGTITLTLTAKGVAGTSQGGSDATSYVKTTVSLPTGSQEASQFTLGASEIHHALALTADKPCRVRMYSTVAQRDADESRPAGTDPTGNHGVLLDVRLTAGHLSMVLSPSPNLVNLTDFGAIPLRVTNESGSTGTITITLTAKGA